MVSVTSAIRYITSASRYHPRYQSRSSMYIPGRIPRNLPRQFQLQQSVAEIWTAFNNAVHNGIAHSVNMSMPSSDFFTDRSKAVLLLWILFCYCLYYTVLSVPYSLKITC